MGQQCAIILRKGKNRWYRIHDRRRRWKYGVRRIKWWGQRIRNIEEEIVLVPIEE